MNLCNCVFAFICKFTYIANNNGHGVKVYIHNHIHYIKYAVKFVDHMTQPVLQLICNTTTTLKVSL